MCGICGVAGPRIDEAALLRATRTLGHRGPEAEGVARVGDNICLGHTRLRIIDLSPVADQPIANEDRSVWLIYNGEIYNFRELRAQLLAAGHTFRSHTDSEVVVHGYEEWGLDDLLTRLNGIFAFAIADTRGGRARLVLARDRMGVKPLVYTLAGGTLAFASEIKALLALSDRPRDVDWQAIYDYFSFLFVPHGGTAFEGIHQLPPAHALTYTPETGELDTRRYWAPLSADGRSRPEVEAAAELRRLLEDTVARQLISDVPLGVFLSGGIDSTVLVALAARSSAGRLKTFTVRFEGSGIAPYDETEYARRVSRMYDTEHREIVVDISRPDELLGLIRCFDQPFANPTFYLSYLISRATREHVTVALSGAGGDELFGGYPRYRVLPYAAMLGRIPERLGRGLGGLLRWLPENYDDQSLRRAKLLARGIGVTFPEQYLRWTYYFSDEEKQSLLGPLLARLPRLAPSVRVLERHLGAAGGGDLPSRVQYLDLHTFLADNILEYTDKTSMATALEVRVPFLDHRLVELSAGMPWAYKVRNGRSKHILRLATADLIPPENLAAPKRGFCPPLATWMATSLDRYFDDRMGPEYVRRQEIFEWSVIERLRRDHRLRRRDNSMELLGIIMFDVWYRTYVTDTAPSRVMGLAAS
jgi:asparagine synthase (glutamine-hydrolysing)